MSKCNKSCDMSVYLATKSTDMIDAVNKGYQQGITDTINKCAEIISKIPNMCGRNCPIDCYFGTDVTCVESWKVYLNEQVRGGTDD